MKVLSMLGKNKDTYK